jgi:hypothetical protein
MRKKQYKYRGLDTWANNQTEAHKEIEARIDKIIANVCSPQVYSGKGWVLVVFCDGEGFGYSIHQVKVDEDFKYRPSGALGHRDMEDARLHAFRHLADILSDVTIIPAYDTYGLSQFASSQLWQKNYKLWREAGKTDEEARELAWLKSPLAEAV